MSIHAFPPGVRILLPADALFVIDVLRRFERFRHGYDQKHLDAAAAAIRERLGDAAVDGLMSDALLLDNELRLRTNGAFDCMPEGAPSATQDELHLIRMIACMQASEYKSAAEHATRLEIVQSRALLMLANKIAARLADYGLRLDHGVLEPNWALRQAPLQHAAAGHTPGLRVVASASTLG